MEVLNRSTESSEDTTWEPNPLPLMVKHPPRITVSNTKIQLEEGILSQPCPKGENDLGWIQLQQKSLLCRERIEGSSVVTHVKILASCKSQESLEDANVFTPTRQLLLVIKQMCQVDRIHDLPAVSGPAFFHSPSRGNECWWGTRDSITVYLWDTMEDQERQDSLEVLHGKDNWVVWKTKDNRWTHELVKMRHQNHEL